MEQTECTHCGQVGYADYDPEKAVVFQCYKCNRIYAYIWCETCCMGGDFIPNIDEQPEQWACADCGSVVPVSPLTYRRIIRPISKDQYALMMPEATMPRSSSMKWLIAGIGVVLLVGSFITGQSTESSGDQQGAKNVISDKPNQFSEQQLREAREQALQKIIAAHGRDLYQLYRQRLDHQPEYRMSAAFEIALYPGGALKGIRVFRTTDNESDFNQQVIQLLSGLDYSTASSPDKEVVFIYPIEFGPAPD